MPAKKLKVVLLYDYPDAEPFVVLNPPKNFTRLLKQWKKLDQRLDVGYIPPGYTPIDQWLKSKGVDIYDPAKAVYVDHL